MTVLLKAGLVKAEPNTKEDDIKGRKRYRVTPAGLDALKLKGEI